MAEQALTFEGMMALFSRNAEELREERRESDQRFEARLQASAAEFDRRMAETNRVLKKTTEEVGKLGNSMGKVIERMVSGRNIIKQFHDLGYMISSHSRNKTFGEDLPDGNQGEIDLFLENGEIAILIEVKTTLKTKNVRKLKDKLEKFRREADSKGDKRRFIGAVAGAVVEGDAKEVAHENGMYVIVQSGKAMEILPTPEGFEAWEW